MLDAKVRKVVTYHPWDCPCDRKEGRIMELSGIDLIVPLGAQQHAQDDMQIALGRQFREKVIRDIFSSSEKIQGRAGGWCYQRQAGSMKALQRVVWSLIFLVFGVYLANAEEQENQVHWGDRKRCLSNSPSRRPMEEDALAGDL